MVHETIAGRGHGFYFQDSWSLSTSPLILVYAMTAPFIPVTVCRNRRINGGNRRPFHRHSTVGLTSSRSFPSCTSRGMLLHPRRRQPAGHVVESPNGKIYHDTTTNWDPESVSPTATPTIAVRAGSVFTTTTGPP